MNVRIIAGRFGGRKIDAPDRRSTHAMSERARNALFNSLGPIVQDAHVLDAFAGSGAIGIEALSRGARDVVFVEKDRIACKIIAKNIELLGAKNEVKLVKTTVSNWIQTMDDSEQFDLIIADPPYHDPQFSTVHKLFGLLKPGGTMVLSHLGKGEVPFSNEIVVVDNRSYANAHLTFFRRDT